MAQRRVTIGGDRNCYHQREWHAKRSTAPFTICIRYIDICAELVGIALAHVITVAPSDTNMAVGGE